MSKKTKSRIFIVVLCFILLQICIGVSFKTSGYVLPIGWKHIGQDVVYPDGLSVPSTNIVICDRMLVENGFPFTYDMPYDDVSDCSNQYNRLAIVLDLLIALIVSVGISETIVKAANKRHGR